MTDKKISLSNTNTWTRLAYMVLFSLLLMAARLVVTLVVIVQFLLVLLAGRDNENLRNLGQGLGKWIYQTVMFLTFNTESKPFPLVKGQGVNLAEGIRDAQLKRLKTASLLTPKQMTMYLLSPPVKILNS